MLFIQGQKVSEVACLRCLHRWTAARPCETFLRDLECPQCGQQGFAIETGETNADSFSGLELSQIDFEEGDGD